MRAVVQRVKEAWVRVLGREVSRIGSGLLVLLGIGAEDGPGDASYMVEKVVNLRIFEDDQARMNRSILDERGEILVVSQFTLYGDCRKGRRPSFAHAAGPREARRLYEYFAERVKDHGIEAKTGVFQAHMEVGLVNDGPVTLLLDSKKEF